MYRDVKKKILSVALCICMIIGMVQVVPKARAAVAPEMGGYYKLQAYDNTYGQTIGVRVYIDAVKFEYNGYAQGPQITSVTKEDGTPIYDGWSLTGATATEIGNYEATVVGGTGYAITSIDTKISYSIVPAKIYNVTCDDLDTVLWNGTSSIPDVTGKVKVSLAGNNWTLNNNQVQVEKISGGDSGPARAKITVTDSEHFNLSESSTKTTEKDYTIAYNLGGSESTGTSEYTMSLKSTSVTYNGQPQVPVIELKKGNSSVNFNLNLFNITYEDNQGTSVPSIIEAGVYTVKVSPKNNFAIISNGGDIYFANQYEGTFTVNPLSFANVTVKLGNEILWKNGDNVTTPEYAYVANNATRIPIENITITDENNQDITNKFAVSWDGDRGIGLAKMILTPKAGSNYPTDQTIQVKYLIKSGLNIDTLTFGTTQYSKSDEIHRPYSGSEVSVSGITVKNDAGVLLNEGYTVSYAYEKNNNWIPITEYNTDYLKTAGKKKVIVSGVGGFAGQSDEKEYTVDVVSMDSEEFSSKFQLAITDSAPFYYKNSAWMPAYSFTYEGRPISPDDYRATWASNTNAGTATLTVTAIGGNFTGSRSASFQILPIDLGDAEIVGSPYTYNGDPIHPTVVVSGGAYGIDYNYTLREGIDYDIVSEDGELIRGELPKDVKATAYTLRIQPKSDNIIGEPRDLFYYISAKNINEATGFQLQGVNGDDRTIEWNGGETKPALIGSALIPDVDYTYVYQHCNSVDAVTGSSMVVITGKGNYTGTKTISYTITPRSFSSAANSDFSFSTSKGGSIAAGYEILLSVKDAARTPESEQALSMTNDYDVQKVEYYDDQTSEWELLTLSINYEVNVGSNKITGLKKAGKYRITISGKGSYKGTLQAQQSCGIDISSYYAHIDDTLTTYVYTGSVITPSAFSLYTSDDNKSTIGTDCFTIEYERDDRYAQKLVDVGKIYVVAVGVPEKGYFGRTSKRDVIRSFYLITSPQWTGDTLSIEVATSGGIKFQPSGGTQIPTVTVKFNGNTLVEDEDYVLSYDEADLQKAGSKVIYINGINNYDRATNKNWQAKYVVQAVDINDIDVDRGNANYNGGRPDFKLHYWGYQLEENKDYTTEIKYLSNGDEIEQVGDKYQITYIVTGKGNFSGTREIPIQINVSSLATNDATFAESAETAQVGQYYVVWTDDDCVISSEQAGKKEAERTAVTPSAFDIVYKKSETSNVTLKRGTSATDPNGDYYITGYGANVTPGESDSNYVQIQGINGYSGIRQLKFKLFTDISGAKTTSTSLIQNTESAPVITKEKWLEVYNQEGERGLVELANLSFDESKGIIENSEYVLSWSKGFNVSSPAVGTYNLRINGSQSATHYYSKGFDISFTIVNGLEGAEIRVNGESNSIRYDGNPAVVTGSGTSFEVKVDGVILTRGTDYEILGYQNNGRIGEATVTIQGKGNYAGTAEHQFKVTYPLDQLVVYMETEDGRFVNTAEEQVVYKYRSKDITPQIRVYCPLDLHGGQTYNDLTPIASTSYTVDWENNRNAGTASVIIKDAVYFTGDTRRQVPFKISLASICPPTQGAISYTTTMGTGVDNIRVTYSGKSFTASDLGIQLNDKGEPLVSGNSGDYVIYYTGDTTNVSDPSNLPIVTFVGVNNYTDSHSISFTITEKSLADPDITADPIELIYTGDSIESAVIKELNIVHTGASKLVYGTDFEIDGYYTDSLCLIPADGVDARIAPSAQGTYYVRVRGIRNYCERKIVQVNVGKKDMSSGLNITFIPSEECPVDASGEPICIYNGEQHCPTVEVRYGTDVLLTKDRDYKVTYSNNLNASEGTNLASVTVTALDNGNYQGSVTREFSIKAKNIAKLDSDNNTMYYSSLEEVYPFTGHSVSPIITVRDSETGATLVDNTDYIVDYLSEYSALELEDAAEPNSYAGEVTMTITGKGNYTGTQQFTYYIGEDISKSYTLINGRSSVAVEYNGLVQAPEENDISVVWGQSSDLTDANGEKRYDIAYYKDGFDKSNVVTRDQIVNAGTYYVAVIGVPSKGTYAKSSINNSCVYTINPRSIAPAYILVSGYDGTYYYTGQPIQPKGLSVEDTDLPISSDANDPQRRSVKLTNGLDYELSYLNNVSAGKASIIVTGKGNYTGSRAAYFNILSSNAGGNNTWDGSSEGTGSISNGTTTIAASDIILGYDNSAYDCMMYNGYERIPTVNIAGISNNEFIITASNNIRPGIATLTITGRGNNFTGTIIKNYKIKADLSYYGTIATIADQVYSGYQITPSVTLTCGGNLLNQGRDYTVTYLNNTNVGKATVMATATSDSYYIGSATGTFNISNTAGGMEITGYGCAYTYTGYPIAPDVVVTMNGRVLNRGTDYTVTYSNNTNVGTATMTVTGIGSFSGTKTITYAIEAKNIENCLTTAVTSYQYTGSTYTPSVTVTDSTNGKTLVAGTDYTITYSNNTNPGTASITVTALSKNYTGSKVIPFKITSAAVSGLRTSTIKNNSIKLAWSAQDYADGYQICNSSNRVVATTNKNSYTVSGLTSCTTYKFKVRSYVENADGSVSYGNFSTAVSAKTLLNTPKLTAKSTSKGKVTLTWTKVSKATGYEIFYSTKKNGIYTRLKTVSKSSARKYVDSGLASGEKYYYTIRAYRTSNGVKTYSNYNTIKSVKVK